MGRDRGRWGAFLGRVNPSRTAFTAMHPLNLVKTPSPQNMPRPPSRQPRLVRIYAVTTTNKTTTKTTTTTTTVTPSVSGSERVSERERAKPSAAVVVVKVVFVVVVFVVVVAASIRTSPSPNQLQSSRHPSENWAPGSPWAK